MELSPMFIILLASLFLIILGMRSAARLILNYRREMRFFLLTPPLVFEKSHFATQQLFSVLHDIGARTSFLEKIFGIRKILSLEIVSDQKSGIRYVIGTTVNNDAQIKASLHAYHPEIQIKKTADPFSSPKMKCMTVREFTQTKRYWFPLRLQNDINEHDSLTYMLSAMKKLQADEKIVYQLVLSPHKKVSSRIVRRTKRQKDLDLINSKLTDKLFTSSIRIAATTSNQARSKKLIYTIRPFLGGFTLPRYQSIRMRNNFPGFIAQYYQSFMCRSRQVSGLGVSPTILSAAEVSSLYHFTVGNQEDILSTRTRLLPLPISQKAADFDLIIGRNNYHNRIRAVGLTLDERKKHVYILGGTGNGKTTLIANMAKQDIIAGKGLAVIDPHGDLAEELINSIPQNRLSDVVYVNPDDTGYPVGINILEIPKELNGDDLARYKDVVTESTIEILRKLFSKEDAGGHRIEYILRNSIQTALTTQNASLFTVYNLLNDPAFRRQVVSELEDDNLKNFWFNEFTKAGEFQRVKMTAGVTAKIGRFLFSTPAKRILEQPSSTINFDQIQSSNKILICNLSKGRLGIDNSNLLGTLILAKIQIATLNRAKQIEAKRVPFYLYVDEFQNFAITSFVQMLSEARKYHLYLTIAEQSTSQQEDTRMVNIILANAGVVVCFRTGNPVDQNLILPFFEPQVKRGDLINLEAYNFYARIMSEKNQEPLTAMTIPGTEYPSLNSMDEAVLTSRNLYGKKYQAASQAKKYAKPSTPKRYQVKH